MKKNVVTKFIHEDNKKIKKLNKLVLDSIKNNESLTQQLLEESEQHLTFVQKLTDRVASFGGSRRFIMSFFLFFTIRIITNTFILVQRTFDPYPFILLNLILSCFAAIQAPVIMMSQNRKAEIDRQRAENDYLINLKAETQIMNIDEKIDILITEQMKNMFKLQDGQLMLLKEIKKQLKK